jgi:hypothetical protein
MTEAATATRRNRTAAASEVVAAPQPTAPKRTPRAPRQSAAAEISEAPVRQGAGTATADLDGTIGGTKQVLISVLEMETGKSGRKRLPEEYPFDQLTPATKTADGKIMGPSFFIPISDRAEGRLAAARKRHKCLFWSRKTFEAVTPGGEVVPGLRIWRGDEALAELANKS